MKDFNTHIKPSKIHGLGLFATYDIAIGEEIIQGFADFNNYQDEWIRYVKKWKVKSFAFNEGFCMVNHSDSPNTVRGNDRRIIACRNILIGDEITEDYNKLPDEENPFINPWQEQLWLAMKDRRMKR